MTELRQKSCICLAYATHSSNSPVDQLQARRLRLETYNLPQITGKREAATVRPTQHLGQAYNFLNLYDIL